MSNFFRGVPIDGYTGWVVITSTTVQLWIFISSPEHHEYFNSNFSGVSVGIGYDNYGHINSQYLNK